MRDITLIGYDAWKTEEPEYLFWGRNSLERERDLAEFEAAIQEQLDQMEMLMEPWFETQIDLGDVVRNRVICRLR